MRDGDGSGFGLDLLLGEAARHPLLDAVEETELARRAEAGDGEALRRLVGSHLRYVVKIARRYRGWGLPMTDLVQQGTLGLIQAVRRFDPDRGVRLSTYATWSIRAAIQEHVLESWSLVRLGTSNAQKALALTFRRFAADWAAHATRDGESADDAIARFGKQFNATAAEVARLARRMAGRDASLDGAALGTPGAASREVAAAAVCDRPTPEEAVAQARHRRAVLDALRDAVGQLSPREQLVIRMRYLEEAKQTFAAIGAELGVSKDRARQLEAKALAKLDALLRPARSTLLP